MMRTVRIPVMAIIVLAMGGTGCLERQGRPVTPCTNVSVNQAIQVDSVNQVDLLFIVDNSGSMREEQTSLAEELQRMVRILASGDFDEDGSLDGPDDFAPVRDLHVGVVTSDMGTGDSQVNRCSMYGDDGILRDRASGSECAEVYPTFLQFRAADGGSPAEFARDVECVATVGTDGCGFEQPLEAILKAGSPALPTTWTSSSYAAPSFFRGRSGYGDSANAGFFRDNAVLALVPLTDEDDCSAADTRLFDPEGTPRYQNSVDLRCFNYPEALNPLERYVDGFIQLRQRAGLLVYAPIVGIPLDLVPEPGESPDYERLVGESDARDERMVQRVDPEMMRDLVPSCRAAGRGKAYPPIRIVRAAQELEARGAGVTVQSICQESFAGALTEIIRTIKGALRAACLPRELNLEVDGTVACDIVTVMPAGMGCADLPGATPAIADGVEVFEGDRAVCVLDQLVPSSEDVSDRAPPAGLGWYYDDYTGEGARNCRNASSDPYQRIAFTAELPSGTEVRLECFQSLPAAPDGAIAVGAFCDPATGALSDESGRCSDGLDPAGQEALACSPVTRGCGVPCTDDAGCRAAGLVGFVCDTRPLEAVDGDFAGNTAPYNFCTNPTCG